MSANPFEDLLKPPPPPMDTYRFATVTDTTPIRIQLDGDDTEVASTPVALVSVVPGDRVWVQLHGLQLVILGVVAPTVLELGANENLNNWTRPGEYDQLQTADATSGTNYPTTVAGHLTVKRGQEDNYIYQWYWAYNSSGAWFRTRYSGTWNAWYAL